MILRLLKNDLNFTEFFIKNKSERVIIRGTEDSLKCFASQNFNDAAFRFFITNKKKSKIIDKENMYDLESEFPLPIFSIISPKNKSQILSFLFTLFKDQHLAQVVAEEALGVDLNETHCLQDLYLRIKSKLYGMSINRHAKIYEVLNNPYFSKNEKKIKSINLCNFENIHSDLKSSITHLTEIFLNKSSTLLPKSYQFIPIKNDKVIDVERIDPVQYSSKDAAELLVTFNPQFQFHQLDSLLNVQSDPVQVSSPNHKFLFLKDLSILDEMKNEIFSEKTTVVCLVNPKNLQTYTSENLNIISFSTFLANFKYSSFVYDITQGEKEEIFIETLYFKIFL